MNPSNNTTQKSYEKLKLVPDTGKRKTIPEYSRYSCYTKFQDGCWCLKNGMGDILYKFKDKQEEQTKAQGMVDVLKSMYQKLQSEFWVHRTQHPEHYYKTWDEANFPHRAIIKGFVPDEDWYDPYSNWFGVSGLVQPKFSPDMSLHRGNKQIQFSLQGVCMPWPDNRDEKFSAVAKACGLKYIGLFEDNKPVYQNWFGQFPDPDILENFIN